MADLKTKAKTQLAEQLRRQGARVRGTKAGWQAYTALGSMGWHRSMSSDRNADRNLRKDVERLGLVWPF